MSLSLDIHRAKLVVRILYARSQDDIQWFISVAIQEMTKNRVDRYVIIRFIDKIINQLELINPLVPTDQEKNMTAAKDFLHKEKQVTQQQLLA